IREIFDQRGVQVCCRRVYFISFSQLTDHSYLSLVQDGNANRTQTAEDVKGIFRFRGRMRDREDGADAAGKTKQGRGRVLNFAIENSVRDQGFDVANRAEDVQENFNPVTAKVEHRTTTGELFLQQPRSGIAGGWIEPLKSLDLRESGHADFT